MPMSALSRRCRTPPPHPYASAVLLARHAGIQVAIRGVSPDETSAGIHTGASHGHPAVRALDNVAVSATSERSDTESCPTPVAVRYGRIHQEFQTEGSACSV